MLKSPISVLQELATQKRIGCPLYEISDSGQDHLKSFECCCTFNGQTATGTGLTKKDAKHNAAANMLKVEGVEIGNTEELPSICLIGPKTKSAIPVNYVGRLNEFCAGNKYSQAVYTDAPIVKNNQFCVVCTFLEFTAIGYGSTKKDAKQDAAKNMLLLIKEKDIGPKYMLEDQKQDNHTFQGQNQALQTYKSLMANLSLGENLVQNTTNINVEVPDTTPSDIEFLKISNWEGLESYILRKGWKHRVLIFNRKPLMLTLKLNGCTLINIGETKEEIYEKFVSEFKLMVRTGFDFSKPLFPLEADA